MTNDEAIQVLERTKSILLEYGWIQFSHGNKDRGFCIQGGLCEAITQLHPEVAVEGIMDSKTGYPKYVSIINLLERNVCPYSTVPYSSSDYNDGKGRTVEDMFDLIDRTIKKLLDEAIA